MPNPCTSWRQSTRQARRRPTQTWRRQRWGCIFHDVFFFHHHPQQSQHWLLLTSGWYSSHHFLTCSASCAVVLVLLHCCIAASSSLSLSLFFPACFVLSQQKTFQEVRHRYEATKKAYDKVRCCFCIDKCCCCWRLVLLVLLPRLARLPSHWLCTRVCDRPTGNMRM